MDITISCDVTEFYCKPKINNVKNVFSINDKSLIISFCDKKGKVLNQSEIDIEDFRKISYLINNTSFI